MHIYNMIACMYIILIIHKILITRTLSRDHYPGFPFYWSRPVTPVPVERRAAFDVCVCVPPAACVRARACACADGEACSACARTCILAHACNAYVHMLLFIRTYTGTCRCTYGRAYVLYTVSHAGLSAGQAFSSKHTHTHTHNTHTHTQASSFIGAATRPPSPSVPSPPSLRPSAPPSPPPAPYLPPQPPPHPDPCPIAAAAAGRRAGRSAGSCWRRSACWCVPPAPHRWPAALACRRPAGGTGPRWPPRDSRQVVARWPLARVVFQSASRSVRSVLCVSILTCQKRGKGKSKDIPKVNRNSSEWSNWAAKTDEIRGHPSLNFVYGFEAL